MILAEVTFSTEGIVVIGTLLTALAGAVAVLFKMLTANRDAEIVALKANAASWEEMAKELGINIEKAVNRKRAAEGLAPFEVIKPIVPEHSSPVTMQQQSTADIGTMRARLVAAAKELNLPQRPVPPPANAEVALAVDKAAVAHAKDSLELSKATIVDAMSDASGAINVAKVAVDTASEAVQPEEPKEER